MALTPNPSDTFNPTTPGDVAHQGDHDEINPMLQPVLDGVSGDMFRRASGGVLEAISASQARDHIGAQPSDADLDAIAALTTTEFGRALLTHADAATARAAIDVWSKAEGETPAGAQAKATAALDSAKVYAVRRGLTLPGTSGHYVQTVHDPSHYHADLDVRVAHSHEQGTSTETLAGRYRTSSTGRVWAFNMLNNLMRLEFSLNGADVITATASAAVTRQDGRIVRVTRDSSTGTVKFYYSDDGGTWTQVGTDQATDPGALWENTSPLEVGAQGATTRYLASRVYWMELRAGIDGAVVANPRFDVTGRKFADPAGNPWTVLGDNAGVAFGLRPDVEDAIAHIDDELHPHGALRRGLEFFGVADNYVSTPHQAAFNTADLDVRAAHSHEQGTTTENLVSKWRTGGSQKAWAFSMINNFPVLHYSFDGSTTLQATASTTMTRTDGRVVRVTRDSSTGTVKFHYSDDDGQTWTQIGDALSTDPGALHASTAPIDVGAVNESLWSLQGRMYWVQLLDGIDGGVLADPVFDVAFRLFRDGSGNPWTVVGNSMGVTYGIMPGTGGSGGGGGDEVTASIEELKVSVRTPDWAASGGAPLLVAPFACEILSADWVQWDNDVPQSDVDYWQLQLRRTRAGASSAFASKATDGTGEAITAKQAWSFDMVTFGPERFLDKGDVLDLNAVKAGAPADLTNNVLTVRYGPV